MVSDDHKGLKAAATRILGATWPRCRIYFMRNLLAYAGRQGRRVVSAFVATAFAQDGAERGVLAYMTFPKEHRTKLHSDEMDKRILRRRGRIAGARATSWRRAA